MTVLDTTDQFKLHVLIVEDDFSFALELQMLLEKLGYVCLGIVESGEKALQMMNVRSPDAILMDIDLKGQMSGLDLANEVNDLNIPILFITSHRDPESYERARNIGMVGFLVKPLNDYTILSAIEACIGQYREKNDTPSKKSDVGNTNLIGNAFLIKKGKLFYKVKLSDIYSISSELEYATIHTADNKFVFRESLKTLLNLLDPTQFLRIHQRHIINLNFLSSLDLEGNQVHLENGNKIPFSRRNKKALEQKWLSFR